MSWRVAFKTGVFLEDPGIALEEAVKEVDLSIVAPHSGEIEVWRELFQKFARIGHSCLSR